MKQNGVVFLAGPAFLPFIFRFEYLISGPKSYQDVRETGPRCGKGCEKWQILVFLVWRTGRHTPTKNSQEYTRRGPVCDCNTNKKLPIHEARNEKKKKNQHTRKIYPCHQKVTSDKGRSKWNVT